MPYKDKEAKKACQKRYRERNKDKIHSYYLSRYYSSLDESRKKGRESASKNRAKDVDKARQRERAYYAANRDKILLRKKR